ncbi:primase-helicase family protein [Bifidobacterium olomucense]|uniref:Uncharacterized protein n=1 Tax=Bifidobacterium olomucense TaxID=2675324 RepID=A0A7Y0EW41_9BIFI|nr:primase-helicase family protein [Bifidobacterium sp. DSM 109959]NMM97493.1 hypothetical protein [Bifidobacterium sp. DSM 109959]
MAMKLAPGWSKEYDCATLRIEGVSDDEAERIVPDELLSVYPTSKTVRLMQSICLYRTKEKIRDGWGIVRDNKNVYWQIGLDDPDLRFEWAPQNKDKGVSVSGSSKRGFRKKERLAEDYNQPAFIIGALMLGRYGYRAEAAIGGVSEAKVVENESSVIGTSVADFEKLVKNDEKYRKGFKQVFGEDAEPDDEPDEDDVKLLLAARKYGVYKLFGENRIGAMRPELAAGRLQLGVDELQAILRLMSQVEGVHNVLKLTRFLVRENGKPAMHVVSGDGSLDDIKLGPFEDPQQDILVPTGGLALNQIAPLVGQRPFDLLCMSLVWPMVCQNDEGGYVLMSDDGGTGKSMFVKGFTRMFHSIAASGIKLNELMKGGFEAGLQYMNLMGKDYAIVEEAEKVTSDCMPPLNELTTGNMQIARWHGGSQAFWCHVLVILTTNKPDEMPDINAVGRRRVTITLQKSPTEEWHAPMLDGRGKRMQYTDTRTEAKQVLSRYDYVASTDYCLAEMLWHGVKLLRERQAQRKQGFEGMLAELSMDDQSNAANAITRHDPEVTELIRTLHDDQYARDLMNGVSKDPQTGIVASPKFPETMLPHLTNREAFLDQNGISWKRDKKNDPRRTLDGKRQRVIALNPDKLRKAWGMVPSKPKVTGDLTMEQLIERINGYLMDRCGAGYTAELVTSDTHNVEPDTTQLLFHAPNTSICLTMAAEVSDGNTISLPGCKVNLTDSNGKAIKAVTDIDGLAGLLRTAKKGASYGEPIPELKEAISND